MTALAGWRTIGRAFNTYERRGAFVMIQRERETGPKFSGFRGARKRQKSEI